jgi:hypothetical protein
MSLKADKNEGRKSLAVAIISVVDDEPSIASRSLRDHWPLLR